MKKLIICLLLAVATLGSCTKNNISIANYDGFTVDTAITYTFIVPSSLTSKYALEAIVYEGTPKIFSISTLKNENEVSFISQTIQLSPATESVTIRFTNNKGNHFEKTFRSEQDLFMNPSIRYE